MGMIVALSLIAFLLLVALALLSRSHLGARTRLAVLDRLEADLSAARSDLAQSRKEREEKEVHLARVQERLAEQDRSFQEERRRSEESSQGLRGQVAELAADLGTERQKLTHASVELATLRSERDAARDQLLRYQEGEKERGERLRAEIENLSNRIFDEKTGKFKEIGTVAIADLVGPVRENLEKLQKALVESEKNDAVRERSLKDALERVVQVNDRLGAQAEGLAKALKGDNKMVGDFGEDLLERILEFSGLRKGTHFVEQGVDLDLKDDGGRHLKPDVVIFLPENRCLVVDSKMSLRSWADAQTDDDALRTVALEAFKRSVRAHVANLASKPYTESLSVAGKVTVDFKFLFIPIEAAFQTSLQLDRQLYRDAFAQRVILVSPTTLLAVLTTIRHTWQQFEIGQNAKAISDRAGLLLDKLLDFTGSMERIGEQLDKARGAFDEARSRLSQGNGNLVGQAKKLLALGVKSDKTLPRSLDALAVDEDDFDATALGERKGDVHVDQASRENA